MNTLKIEKLGVEYQHKFILQNLSYIFESGKTYAIFGKSGAGKSTLLKALCGLTAYVGEIYLNNENISEIKPQILRKKVQYLHQEAVLFHGTVMDNLKMLSRLRYNSELTIDKSVTLSLFEKLALDESYLEKDTKKLSGGEKQRIAIVRAVLMNPFFLLMDEPTSALDIGNESKVLALTGELKKNMGIIIVTHSSDFIQRADKKIYMADGEIKKTFENISDAEIKKLMEQ
ncbi:MAG: ATP-binding cassette domain-containing protein [Flexistipes sinusarabici]|uniref:ATP-binding cassette domain-containing protein n=1 Tax=Flexistipes sinusarabici TaxID=2352 RepID=A0A5D0MPR6_FLESI|nr:ABC transporter ATP-binding protein [Flexistipes sinusarabici]TYB33541.1 MAG: ATP-binding cassette domain-containing protein [Flexistipes sinusarabici]